MSGREFQVHRSNVSDRKSLWKRRKEIWRLLCCGSTTASHWWRILYRSSSPRLQILPLQHNSKLEAFTSTRHSLLWLTHTRPDISATANIHSGHHWYAQALSHNSIHQGNSTSQPKSISRTPFRRTMYSLSPCRDKSPFANFHDFKTKLGYILLLLYDNCKENINHHTSDSSERVARCFFGGETNELKN